MALTRRYRGTSKRTIQTRPRRGKQNSGAPWVVVVSLLLCVASSAEKRERADRNTKQHTPYTQTSTSTSKTFRFSAVQINSGVCTSTTRAVS